MGERTLLAWHWALRIALACIVAVDLLLATDLLVKFATAGVSGVRGYFQHIALNGVDLTVTPPTEVDRIIRISTLRVLGGYAILLLTTGALLWFHHVIGEKRSTSSRARNSAGGPGRFVSDSPSIDDRL